LRLTGTMNPMTSTTIANPPKMFPRSFFMA